MAVVGIHGPCGAMTACVALAVLLVAPAAAELPATALGVASALGAAGIAFGDLPPAGNPALLGDVDRAWLGLELGFAADTRTPQRLGVAAPAGERSGFALAAVRDEVGGGGSREAWRVGFGRRVAAGFAAGAALHLRRDSWSGDDDTSHGVDIGLHARRGRYALGVVTLNATRPQVRTPEATWSDPRVLQAAFAVHAARGRALGGVALGIATSSSTRGELWGGAQLRHAGRIAIAVGASQQTQSAGFGLRVARTEIEVAGGRRDGEAFLASAVRWQFGASRQAQRRDAVRRAADAFSERLDREIEMRQAQRVEAWLDDAALAATSGDPVRAAESYRNVLLLRPDDLAASDGLRRARRAMLLQRADSLLAAGDAAAAAARFESVLQQFPEDSVATQRLADARKSIKRAHRSRSEAAEHMRLGLDAYSQQQYATAIRHLEAACARDPDNSAARDLLDRAHRALEREVTSAVEHGRARLEQGDPDGARRHVETALALAPKRPDALALRNEIERESTRLALVRRAATRVADEAQREDRAPVPPAVLSSGYQQGLQLYRAGDLVAAMRAWEDLARLAPHYEDVDQYLLRVYRVCGLERYTEGRLQDAIEIWEKALRLEPNNAQVRRYLNQANAKLKRAHEPRGAR